MTRRGRGNLLKAKDLVAFSSWSLILLLSISSCKDSNGSVTAKKEQDNKNREPTPASLIPWVLEAQYPHDDTAFTQGLQFHQGILYEGTGGWGSSELREVELKTGKILRSRKLPSRFFGEGVTKLGNSLYQLTWRLGVCFVYDPETLQKTGEFHYQGQGWGLTTNGQQLIMSNGSSTITFIDPDTFQPIRKITVLDGGKPIQHINELEYISGNIYANVWRKDVILIISPNSGRILGKLDLSNLMRPRPSNQEAVLNGIAYDPQKKLLYVTGKLWPTLFAIRLVANPS